jgi:hypothetical protein
MICDTIYVFLRIKTESLRKRGFTPDSCRDIKNKKP